MEAAETGDLSKLKALISAGAGLTHMLTKTKNALTEAACGDYGGHEKPEAERLEILRIFADAGCPVTGEALLRPVGQGEMAIVQFLLAAGANVNAPSPHDRVERKGITPLHAAIKTRNTEIVQALLAAGADPNQYAGPIVRFGTSLQRYPLLTAVLFEQAEVVKMLIDAGADVNAIDPRNGTTAIREAITEGFPEIVQLLLDHGADATTVDCRGKSPIDAACEYRAEKDKLFMDSEADEAPT